MQLLNYELRMGGIMELCNEDKGSNLGINNLLPSVQGSILRGQKCSNIVLELAFVGTHRVFNVDDNMAFISGEDTSCQRTVDLKK
jgi:hypothetical protein